MPWRISDDKLALICREKPIRHINGNTLLALRRQTVYQQGKVNFPSLGALTL